MKKILSILALIGALAFTDAARAQFVQGPARYALFTNAAAILVNGEATTNFPVTMANIVPIGSQGFTIVLGLGGTNSATTTNATIIAEIVERDSKSGLTNVIDNVTYTFSVPQTGVTRYDFIGVVTTNVTGVPSVRIRSMQNTNLASVWITNAVLYTR